MNIAADDDRCASNVVDRSARDMGEEAIGGDFPML
jgi:hypothetical protein